MSNSTLLLLAVVVGVLVVLNRQRAQDLADNGEQFDYEPGWGIGPGDQYPEPMDF